MSYYMVYTLNSLWGSGAYSGYLKWPTHCITFVQGEWGIDTVEARLMDKFYNLFYFYIMTSIIFNSLLPSGQNLMTLSVVKPNI